jgi:hypothetical protein
LAVRAWSDKWAGSRQSVKDWGGALVMKGGAGPEWGASKQKGGGVPEGRGLSLFREGAWPAVKGGTFWAERRDRGETLGRDQGARGVA